MKHNYLYLSFLLLAIFSSCSKEKLTSPEFDVTTTSLTYKVGDPISFTITGNPDNLTFYSGEDGKNYKYKDRVNTAEIPKLTFTSYVQFGTGGLSLLVSTDFDEKRTGIATIASIQSATWTDITSRAKLSSGADNTASDTVNLSDFLALKKPLTFAFKYLNEKSATVRQRTWTIKNFKIESVEKDGKKVALIPSLDRGNWFAVNVLNAANNWAITAAQLQMAGSATLNAEENEDWVISRAIDLTSIKRDVGVAIKTVSTPLSTYTYSYTQPGTYKLVFEASNVYGDGEKKTVKEINLVITN